MSKSKKAFDNGCLSKKEIKVLDDAVKYKINNSTLSSETLAGLKEMREHAVTCIAKSGVPADNSNKKKRKPSKYNIFIGDCMRGGGNDMKTCAANYKEMKESGKL